MNLNKVFIIGRLTADPQLRSTAGGQAVATFSLATNREWKNPQGEKKKEVQFHNVVVWGRQAEVAHQFLKKGSLLFVEGRLQTRSWQDKQGQTRTTTEIISERFQFGPRAGAGMGGGNDLEPKGSFVDEEIKEELPEINIDEGDIKAEDIPF
jgi:single-strand DNA-binding protein